MVTDEELKQWAELCEGATAGPWGADYFDNIVSIAGVEDYATWRDSEKASDHSAPFVVEPSGIEESDFAFIVEARTAMPRLIAEVERLQEDNCAFRDWYAVLRDENTALKAEVERMRKLVLNAADFIQPCKLEQSIFSRREMAHMLRDLAVTK